MSAVTWEERNARRLHLVDKLFDTGGLSDDETRELNRLQKQAGEARFTPEDIAYIDSIKDLKFLTLDEAKLLAKGCPNPERYEFGEDESSDF